MWHEEDAGRDRRWLVGGWKEWWAMPDEKLYGFAVYIYNHGDALRVEKAKGMNAFRIQATGDPMHLRAILIDLLGEVEQRLEELQKLVRESLELRADEGAGDLCDQWAEQEKGG